MKEKNHKLSITTAVERITGTAVPAGFGEPFATAFSRLYKGCADEVTAASFTCSLFLSAILEEYPTTQLHTFVHHVQEHYGRFSFNCNMYETIFGAMDARHLQDVCLLNGDRRPTYHVCSKEDIFEALDFYTNR